MENVFRLNKSKWLPAPPVNLGLDIGRLRLMVESKLHPFFIQGAVGP